MIAANQHSTYNLSRKTKGPPKKQLENHTRPLISEEDIDHREPKGSGVTWGLAKTWIGIGSQVPHIALSVPRLLVCGSHFEYLGY